MKRIGVVTGKRLADGGDVDDLKLAASRMTGANRRAFQAAMAVKYCDGSARRAETVFGWNRHTVELGLHERRTGVVCIGAHAAFGGGKRWEEKHPEVAEALWVLTQSHSQQAPSFCSTLAFTRLTAAEALEQLRAQGFAEETLPSPSTMAAVLNRNRYRLRVMVKAKPQKNSRNRCHLRQHPGQEPSGRGCRCHSSEHELQAHGPRYGLPGEVHPVWPRQRRHRRVRFDLRQFREDQRLHQFFGDRFTASE